MTIERKYGWVRDIPDPRDFPLFPTAVAGELPPKVDLRPTTYPGVYDQLNEGSCTGNQVADMDRDVQMRQFGGVPQFNPSRRFLYDGAREYENSLESDSGCSIRSCMKVLVKQGVPTEEEWPYIPSTFARRPPPSVYASAIKNQALAYKSLASAKRTTAQRLAEMKRCLADGFTFVFGFTVFRNLEAVGRDGIMGMPSADDLRYGVLGAHATKAVAYTDHKEFFLLKNCWGPDWGYRGYFTMPYRYITDMDLAADFWSLRAIES